MQDFKIDFLDHVAINVKDLEASAAWYEKVLGLTRNQFKEWGPFPIFMLAGKTGVALFPANMDDQVLNSKLKNVKIDHFAFNVSRNNFAAAKKHFDDLGISYTTQNHHYFESIYINDPDDHNVELTTILIDEEEFYSK